MNRIRVNVTFEMDTKMKILIKVMTKEAAEKLLYGRCTILELLQESNMSKICLLEIQNIK